MSRKQKKPKLDGDGLDMNPQTVGDIVWFYEHPGGISVYTEGGHMGINLPFRKLVTSLRRIARARGVRL